MCNFGPGFVTGLVRYEISIYRHRIYGHLPKSPYAQIPHCHRVWDRCLSIIPYRRLIGSSNHDRLPTQLALSNEEAAQESEEDDGNHKGKPLIGSPPIATSHDPGNCRIESFDIVQTLSHSFDNTINVLAITQSESELTAQELLNHGGG